MRVKEGMEASTPSWKYIQGQLREQLHPELTVKSV